MNRTIKDATVRRFRHDSQERLRARLQTFPDACDVAKRLETPKGLTAFEDVCKAWQEQPKGSAETQSITLRDRTAS